MRSRTRRGLTLLGLPALALLAVPAMGTEAVGAQVTSVFPDGAPTGWIGISVEMRGTVEAGSGERSTSVLISEVRPGGPAAQAGLRPGDVLLSLNGRAPEDGFGEMVGSLAPGDPVTMVVRRDGRERRFRFEAGTRPREMGGRGTYTVLVQADTLAERMYRAMDSLRVRIAAGEAPRGVHGIPSTIRITRADGGEDTVITLRPGPGAPGRLREIRLPGAPAGTVVPDDARPFRFLLFREDSLAQPGVPMRPGDVGDVLRRRAEEGGEVEVTLRPLAPYQLGRSRAGGAEVVELKPELAEYFAVERGVLVVDVAPGTPAARAGLQPGDVLTHIGAVTVGSVADVRASLAQPRDSVAVRLVRKGARLEVFLRR